MNPTPAFGSPETSGIARTLPVRFSPSASVGIPIQHHSELLPAMLHDFDESTFFRIASLLNVSALRQIAEQTAGASSREIADEKRLATTGKAGKGRRSSAGKAALTVPGSFPVPTRATKKAHATKVTASSSDDRKITSFRFTAPKAHQVQLVGDFTGWEKHPVDLVKTDSGEWATVLLLKPGRYSYDFIVDGTRRAKLPAGKRRSRTVGPRGSTIKVNQKTT